METETGGMRKEMNNGGLIPGKIRKVSTYVISTS